MKGLINQWYDYTCQALQTPLLCQYRTSNTNWDSLAGTGLSNLHKLANHVCTRPDKNE